MNFITKSRSLVSQSVSQTLEYRLIRKITQTLLYHSCSQSSHDNCSPDEEFAPTPTGSDESSSQMNCDHHPDGQDGDGWDDECETGCCPHPGGLKLCRVVGGGGGMCYVVLCVFSFSYQGTVSKDFLKDFNLHQ